MSNGIDLRISRTLDLLGSLRQTSLSYAQREEKLSRDLKTRRYSADQKTREALSDAESSHASQTAATEEHFRSLQNHLESIYEGRRQRVQKYRTVNLRDLPRRAQEVKQSWLGNLQMKNFQEQRKLTADMSAADSIYSGFITQLQELRELYSHARKSFGGYGSLRRLLRARIGAGPSAETPLEAQVAEVRTRLATAREQLELFDQFTLPRFFRILPLPLLFFLFGGAGAATAWFLGHTPTVNIFSGIVSVAVFAAFWILHETGLGKAREFGRSAAAEIAAARRIIDAHDVTSPEFVARRDANRKAIQEEYERSYAQVLQQWGRADDIEAEFEQRTRKKIETQSVRICEKIDRILGPKLQHIKTEREAIIAGLNHEASSRHENLIQAQTVENAALAEEAKVRWDEIETDWQREITPIYRAIEEMNAGAAAISPAWSASLVENWRPPAEFAQAARYGHLELDLTRPPCAVPQSPRLALPGPAKVSLPAALAFPYEGSLLFETSDSGNAAVIGTINNILLRLLANNPPGKVSFTIIDPVRLGQNFAGLMYLGDYEEHIINRRIWTQRDQIEERLAELSEHIEKVIQMYLRNEYATITEYNRQAGSVAEKYHFLVVADFPANFSESAAKRLQSIAASGPRCGIFTLMHWDQRQPAVGDFVPDEFRKHSVCIRRTGNELTLGKEQTALGATLSFDSPPDADLALNFIHQVGKQSVDSNRVQVPFLQVAPKPEEMWSGDTSGELRIAIGRTGATKLQYLAVGKGTRQHALFAGKTGSGKSTLFHVIITNLALECSPDQVEFYLIDFKKGVEFKCYASKHLPHAKVVAIESDREFALSVLQRIDGELRRRGDLFRKLGVQDVPGYRKASGEPMPRTLLIIDEFQEFFVEDDTIAQTASLLFDRIVRQGRAFGIHVLLGSQTLGGSYSLARSTLGQMVIRVALQCNEADSYLIMDENNSAPRLLSRPGEGIYNDAAGAMEGNSPFQVVWLPDDERDEWLDKVQELKEHHPERHYSSPIIFEGNAPAGINENELFNSALQTAPGAVPVAGRVWLGAPNSIKGPTEAAFHRQSGNHLLIVGQREEASLTMLGVSLLALAAQYPKAAAKFVIFQSAPPGTHEATFLESVIRAVPHPIVAVHASGVPAAMNELAAELQARSADDSLAHTAPPVFLLIHALHKFKKLRHEDDFSFSSGGGGDSGPDPGALFDKIITDGSACGIHIITTIDTLNNVNHFMNRKALSEFEMRVVFQMSANDSASLIDSPKAGTLGLHRALFYNEHEGYLETFRPYGFPEPEWLARVTDTLSRR